jgi:hypothetical protein
MKTANVRRRVPLTLFLLVALSMLSASHLSASPAALHTLFFAEGASGIFRTRYLIANADPDHTVPATLHFLNDDGSEVTRAVEVPARGRITVEADDVPGLSGAFALEIRSEAPLAAERVVDWFGGTVGSHAERAIEAPATDWYFAEGATVAPFDVFYLLANPSDTAVTVEATFLRAAPLAPVIRTYSIPARSRHTVWARHEDPALAQAEFSAAFRATLPIVAERAQYTLQDGHFRGGHAAAGSSRLATDWYFAEGATGAYFDTFLLLANPSSWVADVVVTFLLPSGDRIERTYALPARSRTTVWTDHVDPALADTAVSTRVRVVNGVGIAVERAMWWPFDSTTWREGHVSAGAITTAQRWVVAGGESQSARGDDTFVLLTNLSDTPGTVRVTLGYEDGGPASSKLFAVGAHSRLNVWPTSDFPESVGRSFAVFVETLGDVAMPLVVESSVYSTRDGDWAGGRNALATPLDTALAPSTTTTVVVGGHALLSTVGVPLPPNSIVQVTLADPSLAEATVDATSGDVVVTPRGTASGTTTLTVALLVDGHVIGTRTHTVQVVGGPIAFGQTYAVDSRLFPDFNRPTNGVAVPFGTKRTVAGHLEPVDLTALGLFDVWMAAYGSTLRETRMADFNGDGFLDLIAVHYAPITDTQLAARLYFGQSDGTFVEDHDFHARGYRGYGHTILAADFDNDGDLDVFIPNYTHNDAAEQNFLLRNDGAGHFEEIADQAGVAMRNWPFALKVEGAQAVDFDEDGWIDFYVGSHLFRNNGDMTFTAIQHDLGMFDDMGGVGYFDEGVRFLDWNNDGRLDLVLHHPWYGPRLLEFDGVRFHWRRVFVPQDPSDLYEASYGMNVYDINGDGLEDVVVAGGVARETVVMKNVGTGFVRETTSIDGWHGDAVAFGDIDGDGRIDVYSRRALLDLPHRADSAYALNTTPSTSSAHVRIELVGDDGAPNQAGRVVRVSPTSRPTIQYTRIVDGGSGFASKNQYELLIPVPFNEPHLVRASFDTGTVEALVLPGERVRIYRSGLVERY